MSKYMVSRTYDKRFELIEPNMIYNRFDLWHSINGTWELWKLYSKNKEKYFEVLFSNDVALLGIYCMKLNVDELHAIVDYVFKNKKQVTKITYSNGYIGLGNDYCHNHYRIHLPTTREEIDSRLSSKGRYNIRREKRIVNQDFGGYSIKHISIHNNNNESLSRIVLQKYFEFKKASHVEYNTTYEEYCSKYHVTDIYYLKLLDCDKITAIILSCEISGGGVYVENMSYDRNLKQYSLGQILYDEYLKLLLDRGYKDVYLLGGDYTYKKRYGSIEEKVYDCTIFRQGFLTKSYYSIRRFVGKFLRRIHLKK